jgi:hypothetical protein
MPDNQDTRLRMLLTDINLMITRKRKSQESQICVQGADRRAILPLSSDGSYESVLIDVCHCCGLFFQITVAILDDAEVSTHR